MALFRFQRMHRIEKSCVTRTLKGTMARKPTLALIKGYLNINRQTLHVLISSRKYMLLHT